MSTVNDNTAEFMAAADKVAPLAELARCTFDIKRAQACYAEAETALNAARAAQIKAYRTTEDFSDSWIRLSPKERTDMRYVRAAALAARKAAAAPLLPADDLCPLVTESFARQLADMGAPRQHGTLDLRIDRADEHRLDDASSDIVQQTPSPDTPPAAAVHTSRATVKEQKIRRYLRRLGLSGRALTEALDCAKLHALSQVQSWFGVTVRFDDRDSDIAARVAIIDAEQGISTYGYHRGIGWVLMSYRGPA